MKNKIKVLILGINKSNFLDPLYSSISEHHSNIDFNIDSYLKMSDGAKRFEYSNYYDFDSIRTPTFQLVKAIFTFFFTKLFWQLILFEASRKSSFSHLKRQIVKFSINKLKVDKYWKPLNIDIYHFHFCVPENLTPIFFLPTQSKVICSFWGSDLLRMTGVSNVFYVSKALKKANIITVQTLDLSQILLAKYGRELKSKLNVTPFILNKDIYDQIDDFKTKMSEVVKFKNDNEIGSNKIVIAIGHNGFEENNHIEIINHLEKLPENLLDKCVFILHVSYGANITYLEKLKSKTEKSNLNIILIEKFFELKEIALLRLATDLLIQAPITDALSAAMTEVLYCGNLVVAGGWLPYNIFWRNDINIQTFELFDQLNDKLSFLLKNLDEYKRKNISNPNKVRDLLLSESIAFEWSHMYDQL